MERVQLIDDFVQLWFVEKQWLLQRRAAHGDEEEVLRSDVRFLISGKSEEQPLNTNLLFPLA